jgi:hypothetical protein
MKVNSEYTTSDGINGKSNNKIMNMNMKNVSKKSIENKSIQQLNNPFENHEKLNFQNFNSVSNDESNTNNLNKLKVIHSNPLEISNFSRMHKNSDKIPVTLMKNKSIKMMDLISNQQISSNASHLPISQTVTIYDSNPQPDFSQVNQMNSNSLQNRK